MLIELAFVVAVAVAVFGLVIAVALIWALTSGRDSRYRARYQAYLDQRARVLKALDRGRS